MKSKLVMPIDHSLNSHMTRIFRFCASVIGWVFLLAFTVQAAPVSPLFFKNMGDAMDANSGVTSVIQDRQGFMWIGTTTGIFRYDGYNFIQYQNKPDNPISLPGFVFKVFEDRQGTIWICTKNGLARLDPETNTFKRFTFGHAKSASKGTSQVVNDDKGGLWLATQEGLQYFNQKNGLFKEYKHDPSQPDSIATDNVKALALDNNGGLWIATWPGGLDYLASGSSAF
ncbi:MAG: two-component regulator propeller domain-containing protein, partial [Gallionella sp.]